MSRVVFMCGPAGSGKSTYARKLEAQGMTRLSFDVAAWERVLTVMPLPPEAHAGIGRELQERLYGFRLNLVVSDSIRADASRKKYGFRDMDAQAALSRLCRN